MDFRQKIYDIIFSIQKVCRFLKRLIFWLPIIWKQEDWDISYLYDLIEIKLKEIRKCLLKDDIHKDSDLRVREIDICLAYLDRYRNWTNYIEYPIDDIIFEPASECTGKMVSTNSHNEARRKLVRKYEDFNYKMFWKRFMQWHQKWWC